MTPRQGELITGRIPVLECLRAGKRPARKLFLLAGGNGLDELRDAARAAKITIEDRPRKELDDLAGEGVHQGAVLKAAPLPLLDLALWLKHNDTPASVCLVLDSIEDPHNFGAILRTASAFGADAVIFAKDRAAPLSPAALKAAAGAAEYLNLIQVTNIARALDTLKENNYWTAALDADAPQDLWQARLDGRIALVIGNEGEGIRRLVRAQCDFAIRIPIQGPISSLNASVSAALALAECIRQQKKTP